MIKRIAFILALASAAMAQTNAVFYDGSQLYSTGGDGGGTNLLAFSRGVEYTVLTWSSADLQNNAINLFGTDYDVLSSGVTIDSTTTNTVVLYNRHVVLDVQSLTSTGVVTIGGLRIDEITGTATNWTENITVLTTNCYQTSAKFVGTVSNYTANANITADVIATSYYDFQNQDFVVSNVRVSWKPSNPVWDIGIDLLLIDNDGKANNLIDGLLDFASTDTVKRAANGELGHAKAVIGSRIVLGSQNEGIVVRITGDGDANPANILEFDLTIGCDLR